MKSVIVVGAGIAGVLAGNALRDQGFQVKLVEKGASAGGRMATTNLGQATFDHGAQFFTATSEEFQHYLKPLVDTATVLPWFQGTPRSAPFQEAPASNLPDERVRYRGDRNMARPVQKLADGVTVQYEAEVTSVQFLAQRWLVTTGGKQTYTADYLVLTCPPAEMLPLLAGCRQPALQETLGLLRQLDYDPCIAVLATLNGPSALLPPGALLVRTPELYWLADNFQKGISRHHCITLHSTGPWARQHLDLPEELLGQKLLALAEPYIGQSVREFRVTRWSYAKVVNPLDLGSVFLPHLNLGLAGDAFLGARVEAAALSGLHLADQLSSSL